MRVQLLIEGGDALRAAQALAATPGLAVTVSTPSAADPRKELLTLSVVATIVGVASGGVTLADTLLRWRRRWRAAHDHDDADNPGHDLAQAHEIERVVIVVDGRRAPLDTLDEAGLRGMLAPGEGPSS